MPIGIYKRTNNRGWFKIGNGKGLKRPEISGKNHPFFGKHRSEETKRKISEHHKRTGHKPLSNKGKKLPSPSLEQRKKLSEAQKGKKHSKETIKKITGKNNHNWGKHFSEEIRKKMSESQKRRVQEGRNHLWKGGISNNPYPFEFNFTLKLKIRTRDNFTCCLCGRTEREELEELNRVLSVNHIDFDKNNCKEENLNTLCLRCNVKINRERDYWINYFLTSL